MTRTFLLPSLFGFLLSSAFLMSCSLRSDETQVARADVGIVQNGVTRPSTENTAIESLDEFKPEVLHAKLRFHRTEQTGYLIRFELEVRSQSKPKSASFVIQSGGAFEKAERELIYQSLSSDAKFKKLPKSRWKIEFDYEEPLESLVDVSRIRVVNSLGRSKPAEQVEVSGVVIERH